MGVEEQLRSLIIPDILTPEQFYEGDRSATCIRPVKRLMFAVLADALQCFQTNADARTGKGRALFAEVEVWLWDSKAEGPFAFEIICETLGIDPNFLRSGLHEWRLRQSDGRKDQRIARLIRRSPVRSSGQLSVPRRHHQQTTGRASLDANQQSKRARAISA